MRSNIFHTSFRLGTASVLSTTADTTFSFLNLHTRYHTAVDQLVKTICEAAVLKGISLPEQLITIESRTQTLTTYQSHKPIKTYTISTSKFGLGSKEGSFKTPSGFHEVADHIGAGEPLGRVFESRIPLDDIVTEKEWTTPGDTDLILTRILRLRGLEEHNALSFDRYIYIHGTNQEHLLGTAASHGCIRMANRDVVELFEWSVNGNTVCWIR